MELIVSGLNETTPSFAHLWGRYILGMKPSTHCLRGLKTKAENPIHPGMKNGAYLLRDDLDFFYLCGVGKQTRKDRNDPLSRQHTNVHLAVTPRKGSIASIGSVYGSLFTIRDAEAIPIQPLPEGFAGLNVTHYRCKNFQFGYQIFDVSEEDCHSPDALITKRRPAYETMLRV